MHLDDGSVLADLLTDPTLSFEDAWASAHDGRLFHRMVKVASRPTLRAMIADSAEAKHARDRGLLDHEAVASGATLSAHVRHPARELGDDLEQRRIATPIGSLPPRLVARDRASPADDRHALDSGLEHIPSEPVAAAHDHDASAVGLEILQPASRPARSTSSAFALTPRSFRRETTLEAPGLRSALDGAQLGLRADCYSSVQSRRWATARRSSPALPRFRLCSMRRTLDELQLRCAVSSFPCFVGVSPPVHQAPPARPKGLPRRVNIQTFDPSPTLVKVSILLLDSSIFDDRFSPTPTPMP